MSYFELEEIEKKVMISITSDDSLDSILNSINKVTTNPGSGIAFSIPISGGPKYLENLIKVNKGGSEYIVKREEYSLIITIVSSGYAKEIMNCVKKCGASGGTLINGHGMGSKEAVKFLGVSIEPEKDVVLNVVKTSIKGKVLESIVKVCGINTPGKGITFSLPIDKAVGFGEMDAVCKNVSL